MSIDPDNCRVLVSSGTYRVLSQYESAFLDTGDAMFDIGDLDGEPSCALIDTDAGWCVVGGHGLWVAKLGAHFKGLQAEQPKYTVAQVIWIGQRTPDFTGLWRVDDELIHGLSNPGLADAALFEINVTALTFRRI